MRKPKKKPHKKISMFRSGFEEVVAASMEKDNLCFLYEKDTFKFSYVTHKRYTPDFCIETPKGTVYLETKGVFTVDDRKKLSNFKTAYPDVDLRLLFMQDNRLSKKSKTRYSEWCIKNGFKYAIGTRIPREWLEEWGAKKSRS